MIYVLLEIWDSGPNFMHNFCSRYLHEVCSLSVVHKNIKSANILLDAELNPHLSDCGLASYIPNAEQVILEFMELYVVNNGFTLFAVSVYLLLGFVNHINWSISNVELCLIFKKPQLGIESGSVKPLVHGLLNQM